MQGDPMDDAAVERSNPADWLSDGLGIAPNDLFGAKMIDRRRTKVPNPGAVGSNPAGSARFPRKFKDYLRTPAGHKH
jgi:hypothetical protein